MKSWDRHLSTTWKPSMVKHLLYTDRSQSLVGRINGGSSYARRGVFESSFQCYFKHTNSVGEIQGRPFRGLPPPRTTSAASFEPRLQRLFLQQSTHSQQNGLIHTTNEHYSGYSLRRQCSSAVHWRKQAKLLQDQQYAYSAVYTSIHERKGVIFFLDAPFSTKLLLPKPCQQKEVALSVLFPGF